MQNLDQIRSANAIQHRDKRVPGKEGGEVVKKIPTLMRQNGLLATAAYACEKKGQGKGYANEGYLKVFEWIIEHLAHERIGRLASKMSVEDFIGEVSGKSSADLRDITAEVNAYLAYLRRYVKKGDNDAHRDAA